MSAAPARRAPNAPVEAYVLHQYDWSETSLILDLFTRERGRLAVAAKGAKRPYSQLRTVLLPFQRLRAQLGRTPADEAAEVLTLRGAEWAGGVGGGTVLPASALFSGLYLNELLMKLLARQDPHPALFDAYAAALARLAAAAGDDGATQALLRAFELVLLRELGLLPDLAQHTHTAEPLQTGGAYALHAEGGLVPAAVGEPALPGAAWVGLEAALAHGSLAALQAACARAGPLRGILRHALHYHLGHARLRTRHVLLETQKLLGAPARGMPAPPAEKARP